MPIAVIIIIILIINAIAESIQYRLNELILSGATVTDTRTTIEVKISVLKFFPFAISDGDAFTNDLYMDGPAAHIDVSGRIGLATQDYDQRVVVTPRVSSSIPLVGGLAAANPGVGVGLWVADKLFGDKINRITRVQYSIIGSWDDPQVVKVGEDKKVVQEQETVDEPDF